ncbi:hypothetical protein HDU97_010084 [Phlyctochytrium planicorne]|nr:hypothetical protein HDU97_010084 [Phlyctochytrium planicorne]
MSQASSSTPATTATAAIAAIPTVPTTSSSAASASQPPAVNNNMDDPSNDPVVSMYITLFGIRTPFTFNAPRPIAGTEPQEYKSKLWLLGNGQDGSIGLPLFFSEYFAFDESVQTKQNREYRNSFLKKIFWSIVSIVVLGVIPVTQVIYLDSYGSALKHDYQFIYPGFSKLYTPIWNKRVVVTNFYQTNPISLAFFEEHPLKTSHALIKTLEVGTTYDPSPRLVFPIDAPELEFQFHVKPVPDYWLKMSIQAKSMQFYYTLNVTEYVEDRRDPSWNFKIPKIFLRSDVTVTLETMRTYSTFPNPPKYRELNWSVVVGGRTFNYDLSKADHICQATDFECSYPLTGLFNRVAFMYTLDGSDGYFSLSYERRIATYVAFFGVMVFFCGAILHALWALWVYDVSLKDRVKWVWRKKVHAGVALNADEERPLLG